MCGRFTLRSAPTSIGKTFRVDPPTDLAPRYNIAPTQSSAVVHKPGDAQAGEQPSLSMMRWGLVPFWAKELKIGARMINARAETIAQKPAYRRAFAQRRCLVVADGFYEWRKLSNKRKQPYYFCRPDEQPFALAGLWEKWRPDDETQSSVRTFTIITTDPNPLVKPVHNRMPVILDPAHYERWLDPALRDAEALGQMLRPCPEDWLTAWPVSPRVNNVKNDDPECIAEVEPLS
jgi:putative SOS response-associated peptidase YedK